MYNAVIQGTNLTVCGVTFNKLIVAIHTHNDWLNYWQKVMRLLVQKFHYIIDWLLHYWLKWNTFKRYTIIVMGASGWVKNKPWTRLKVAHTLLVGNILFWPISYRISRQQYWREDRYSDQNGPCLALNNWIGLVSFCHYFENGMHILDPRNARMGKHLYLLHSSFLVNVNVFVNV